MRPLSDIFAFLETTQRELSHLLAAPIESKISVKNGAIETKSHLVSAGANYILLYDRYDFENGKKQYLQRVRPTVPCNIRQLPFENARKIEAGLFGLLVHFSIIASTASRLGPAYVMGAEIQYNNSEFGISCCSASDDSKLSLCQLHRNTKLKQFPLGLPNTHLSHIPGAKEVPKQFEDILKSLDTDETVMIDPMYNCVLFTRQIKADTKTTLSEYFSKSSHVSDAAVKVIDDMCEELLAGKASKYTAP
ncbi:MAG: hypothetical protein HY438_00325 [DPANN group archaeon]|nr:hypothetical protein [DPANN group archaeon]